MFEKKATAKELRNLKEKVDEQDYNVRSAKETANIARDKSENNKKRVQKLCDVLVAILPPATLKKKLKEFDNKSVKDILKDLDNSSSGYY